MVKITGIKLVNVQNLPEATRIELGKNFGFIEVVTSRSSPTMLKFEKRNVEGSPAKQLRRLIVEKNLTGLTFSN